jgi:hypothetical protein
MEQDCNNFSKVILKTKPIKCSSREQSWGTDKYRGGNEQMISESR